MKRLRTRVMGRTVRTPTPHTEWCTRDHRCGLDEHRSAEQIVDGAVDGRAVITRVRAGGVEYAEVRARIPLHGSEAGAHWQVVKTLRLVRGLLAAVAIRPGVLRTRDEQPAVDRRHEKGVAAQ